ncbi:hypothetical protein BDZ90DRAFT_165373 [Jaminaea rosea]|uniref:Endoribonuclease YSH1 n=1 Tax=Jaminaea rosea TaxID=1569628 RepID=A0A316USC8_9BASI|nr:hypothetical protein BDZ90DRAFT_165373 [Jaminaea rosea]PWN28209.1 hypothetical protein BDZ90DRAFT_165373 [Jaminaea rosea]
MEKTNFKEGRGKVYMTHPTKAVYRFLMSDFVRISNAGNDDNLFDEGEMLASWRQIEAVDFHQDVSVGGGLRFTPYHAGHVLGACMFLIEIAGLRILYTGDFSREEDRHLVQAEVPPVRPDVLICESTYGVQSLEPRIDKEQRFTQMVQSIVSRGGRVLLPVFVLGRAQELLLLLDEFWSAHPELQKIPIYYASSLARKCISIYQTYIHTMNDHIRSRFNRRDNPFVFKHVSNLKSLDKFEDKGPCVMMASPGFMQSGVSRELLERWAPDRRNGLIVTGYSIEGTMARNILNEPDEIISVQGQKIPRRMSIDYISFSAHVDYAQNSKFIDEIKAQHVVLVHGEATAMARLRAALQSKYSERSEDVKIHTPRNCEPLRLQFKAERLAKAVGSIAEKPPKAGSTLKGLLVSKDFAYTILDPKDLAEFTGLNTSTIIQRQRVALNVGWDMVRWHLEGMYGSVQEGVDVEGRRTMRVMTALDVKQSGVHELLLEWVASVNNDMVADSALALLLGIDSSPATVKMTTRPCGHSHGHEGQGKGDAAEEAKEEEETVETVEKHPHADKVIKDAEEAATAKRAERAMNVASFLEAYYGDVEEIQIGGSQDTSMSEDEKAETKSEEDVKAEQENGDSVAEANGDAKMGEGEQQVNGNGEVETSPATTTSAAEPAASAPTPPPPSLESTIPGPSRQALRVRLDDKVAIVDLEDALSSSSTTAATSAHLSVYSRSEALRRRVLHLVALADRAATSAADTFRMDEPMCSELFLGVHSRPVEPGEADDEERGIEGAEGKKRARIMA